jgi:hypothetical protein
MDLIGAGGTYGSAAAGDIKGDIIMADKFNYDTFVLRNNGYVSPETQKKVRNTTLLIAGCGIGSSVAVCAARFGFEKFILVDGDVVDAHNMNRQFYDFADVGKPKVDALKDKILRINPEARIEALHVYLTPDNTDSIVRKADICCDTVDFLDLPAILGLHKSAKRHNLAIFTALSISFGAGVLYFPAGSSFSLANLVASDVELAGGGADNAPGYKNVFALIIKRLCRHLDMDVVEQITKTLVIMENGKPCPASQVAVGSFTVAAMSVSMMHDLLAGNTVPSAPEMVIHSFRNHQTKLVNIAA